MLSTRETVEAFERDGFVLVERALDENQLSRAQQGVEWAMQHQAGSYQWIKQRTYEWFPEQPIFVELIEHPLPVRLAEMWLGVDFHLIAAQCSRNTKDDPYAPGAMQIHADTCFFPQPAQRESEVEFHRSGFSAMWYLQDTPLEMGPTELIAGSHIGEQTYQDSELTPEMLFRRPIPAGSLLFFNHHTWHRGALNATDTPRDLITNAYARPEIEKVQLTTPQPDGSQVYVECRDLLVEASPLLRQLLRDRTAAMSTPREIGEAVHA